MRALGTCATYGGIPAMRNNPTGAMGLPDHPGWRWTNGIGGCPSVGGICIACTMPGFPDKFMPFMDPDPWGSIAANFQRFTYGPLFRYFRKRNLSQKFDREPDWRRPGGELTSGYEPPAQAD